MRRSGWGGLFLASVAFSSAAQLTAVDPDWKESEVPAPPAFRIDRLIPIEMPRYISLKFGVDPDTLSVSSDGLVRYVMVGMSLGGTVNATYEGIRCVTGEVKTYARYTVTGQWSQVANPQWKALNGNQPSPHALALARQGVCNGRAAAMPSAAEIITRLRTARLEYSR